MRIKLEINKYKFEVRMISQLQDLEMEEKN